MKKIFLIILVAFFSVGNANADQNKRLLTPEEAKERGIKTKENMKIFEDYACYSFFTHNVNVELHKNETRMDSWLKPVMVNILKSNPEKLKKIKIIASELFEDFKAKSKNDIIKFVSYFIESEDREVPNNLQNYFDDFIEDKLDEANFTEMDKEQDNSGKNVLNNVCNSKIHKKATPEQIEAFYEEIKERINKKFENVYGIDKFIK